MRFFNNYANADAAVINLVKLLGLNIGPQQVADELEKHPANNSILGISEVLNWFKIENAAYHVSADDLADVPAPFIAHTKKNNDFVIVSQITDKSVTLSDHQRGDYRLPLAEFKKIYNGTVLVADAPEEITTFKQSWPDRLAGYKTPAALLVLGVVFIAGLFLFTGYYSRLNWQLLTLTLIKTAGLITSVLLLVQSIDKNNPLIQTLCGGNGKTNCNAILTSKAANVFEGLTWSEVGFFYFAATWLALLFGSGTPGILPLLAILNIVSLPYTIFSINYQARIAKQWCVFCTAIQALLWLEFAVFIPTLLSTLSPLGRAGEGLLPALGRVKDGLQAGEGLLICTILPIALWLLLKPLLLKSQQLKTLKGQLQKFKYNKELFDTALKEQPKYALPADDWSIVLGNTEANTIITMVSNPYCQPCATAHNELDEWLDRLDDIQLRIVFTANNDDKDKKTTVARHLMALNALPDKTIIKRALHDWYNQQQKNYGAWAKAYPVALDESKFNVLEKQRAWCNMAEIKTTPTLLVNGYRLPEVYRVADIKYMLG